jgi:hypothetical protein
MVNDLTFCYTKCGPESRRISTTIETAMDTDSQAPWCELQRAREAPVLHPCSHTCIRLAVNWSPHSLSPGLTLLIAAVALGRCSSFLALLTSWSLLYSFDFTLTHYPLRDCLQVLRCCKLPGLSDFLLISGWKLPRHINICILCVYKPRSHGWYQGLATLASKCLRGWNKFWENNFLGSSVWTLLSFLRENLPNEFIPLYHWVWDGWSLSDSWATLKAPFLLSQYKKYLASF